MKINNNTIKYFFAFGIMVILASLLLFDKSSSGHPYQSKDTSQQQQDTDYASIRKVAENIINNDINFSRNNSNLLASESFNENNFRIEAYKFENNNTTFIKTYEGSENVIDLSVDVDVINKLENGEYEKIICGNTSICEERKIIIDNFAGRTWAHFDYMFMPSGTWHRTYITFDKDSSNLVYITYTTTKVSKENYLENNDISDINDEVFNELQIFEENVLKGIN